MGAQRTVGCDLTDRPDRDVHGFASAALLVRLSASFIPMHSIRKSARLLMVSVYFSEALPADIRGTGLWGGRRPCGLGA
jgi:hypothetical protein